MTIQELIDALTKVKKKDLQVHLNMEDLDTGHQYSGPAIMLSTGHFDEETGGKIVVINGEVTPEYE